MASPAGRAHNRRAWLWQRARCKLVCGCGAGRNASRSRQPLERRVCQGAPGPGAQTPAGRERHANRDQHAGGNGTRHGAGMADHAAARQNPEPAAMKRSSRGKILTTHVGSLPRPDGTDRPGAEDDAALSAMVKEVVARQRATGLDVINEGEYTKGGDWLSFVDGRLHGFAAQPPAGGTPLV